MSVIRTQELVSGMANNPQLQLQAPLTEKSVVRGAGDRPISATYAVHNGARPVVT
jgi:hypothetical protein